MGKNGTTRLACGALLGSTLLLGSAGSAWAQQLEEIIVTASKRPERISDVPYAITAVSGAEITERGVTDLKDLQYSIPGLAITPVTVGQDRINLRGVNAGSGTGQPIVGVYVDDVGISIDQQQRDIVFPLVDLDRVEVLRGPQGTLYGQGSEAGTIRYITKSPSLTQIEGYVEANGYSQDQGDLGYNINAAFGGPIVQDKLAARVTIGHEKEAGWIDYPKLGQNNANNLQTDFIRAKILWLPVDALKVTILYQYLDQDAATSPYVSSGTQTNSGTFLTPIVERTHVLNAVFDLDLGFATLSASTGYLSQAYSFGFPPQYFGFTINTAEQYDQFTQELRLVSNPSDFVDYVVGAYYRDLQSNFNRIANAPAPLTNTYANALNRNGDNPVSATSAAIFGDATYHVLPDFDASVGLRYYRDWRHSFVINTFTGAAAGARQSASFDSTDPRFNLKYKPTDEIETYVQIAKGFRSGGFNTSGSIPAYTPETVWSYEGGVKGKFLDQTLFVDVSGYYLNYSDRQSNNIVYISGAPFSVTTNGGSASGPGVELAATWKLPYGLAVDGTFSWQDITFDKTTAENVAGERFAYVPAKTASLSLSQRFPLFDQVEGHWRIDYQHADDNEAIFRSVTPGTTRVTVVGDYKQPSLDIVNIRAGVTVAERLDLTLDVYNLTNRQVRISELAGSPVPLDILERPRSFGITARYSFP